MDVDFEKAWLRLKVHISEKRSHGQDGLFEEMSRIEAELAFEPPSPQHPQDGPLPPDAASAAPEGMPSPLAAKEATHGRSTENDGPPGPDDEGPDDDGAAGDDARVPAAAHA